MCLTSGRVSSPHVAFTRTCRIGGIHGGGDGCQLVTGVGEHVTVDNFSGGGGVDGVFDYASAESVVGIGREEDPIADSARNSLDLSL